MLDTEIKLAEKYGFEILNKDVQSNIKIELEITFSFDRELRVINYLQNFNVICGKKSFKLKRMPNLQILFTLNMHSKKRIRKL